MGLKQLPSVLSIAWIIIIPPTAGKSGSTLVFV